MKTRFRIRFVTNGWRIESKNSWFEPWEPVGTKPGQYTTFQMRDETITFQRNLMEHGICNLAKLKGD